MRFEREHPPLDDGRCSECGAEVPEEFLSCEDLFRTVLALLQSSPAPRPLIWLFTDAFSLQHPRRAGQSAQAYAAHLGGLCCGLEHAGAPDTYAALQRWLAGPAGDLARPQPPAARGALTLRYPYEAHDDEEFAARTQAWAAQVWAAYADQQELARGWLRAALGLAT